MPIEPDDVVLNKAAIIERSLRRVREEYAADPELRNFTHIDAMTLNIERACQAAIDLALHVVSVRHLGMPQSSGDAFKLLNRAGLLSVKISAAMSSMTGFRNIAVHEYQDLSLEVLHSIAEAGWLDLVAFCREMGVEIRI
ncbi:type VII toxin-antitoxin system HepT family RNase toxin [Sediminispirochaeta smaragdinae]|uniref:DUF86 domain-containing protein n=1 Tax=Sediminispirochaeta smaragdinae (strain DSM 11293 / JCM 15392 / SEBR 4228) TaxID=573413 RepID=E1RA29_SEDSS|nr:DUF86 domain-containing protein [Sediminispirochaeta smaragdinae]ADK83348.1 protein of unknown function DUF86 [Sediminispirochaeta smaragdinae DSM 11293]